MAKQKMVAGESQRMIASDENPVRNEKRRKVTSKVRMTLYSGQSIEPGKEYEIWEGEYQQLLKNYGGDLSKIFA